MVGRKVRTEYGNLREVFLDLKREANNKEEALKKAKKGNKGRAVRERIQAQLDYQTALNNAVGVGSLLRERVYKKKAGYPSAGEGRVHTLMIDLSVLESKRHTIEKDSIRKKDIFKRKMKSNRRRKVGIAARRALKKVGVRYSKGWPKGMRPK